MPLPNPATAPRKAGGAVRALVAVAATLLAACAGDGGATTPGGGGTSGNFRDVQDGIFTPNCALAGCHSAASASGGLKLQDAATSYANLVNVASQCAGKLRVVPGDTEASYLLDKLGAGAEPCGARMPFGAPPLASEDIDLISAWIAAGAPPAASVGLAHSGQAVTARSSSTSTTTTLVTTSSTLE